MSPIARALVVLSALLILPLTAKNAYAGPITFEFEVSWSGEFTGYYPPGYSRYIEGSGVFTATEVSSDSFLITAINGTQNGYSISLLPINTFPEGNDNLLFPASKWPVDFQGFGFTSGPIAAGIFGGPGWAGELTSDFYFANLTTFTVTVVEPLPEPSGIIILSSGLMLLVGFVRRKRMV